jgi:hypothetical protein
MKLVLANTNHILLGICKRCLLDIYSDMPHAKTQRKSGMLHAWCAQDAKGKPLYPQHPKPQEATTT